MRWDVCEAEGQQAGAQQVAQRCQVGDGEVVWVQTLTPRPPNQHLSHTQQDHHL